MPVEIEELVIRIVVTPESDTAGSTTAPPAAPSREELVAEVAEQVLAILREKEER